jgi:hypothetical protein
MPGVGATLKEYAAGKLRSGSANGPTVKSRRQAIAIGLSEEKKASKNLAAEGIRKSVKKRKLDCRSPNCVQPDGSVP